MRFQASITTGKNTSIATPKITVLPITLGLIHRVTVQIRLGHAYLTGAALFDGMFQFHPMTTGEWIRGNGIVVDDEIMFLKEDQPSIVVIKAYNLDDTYDHELIVSVHVEDKDVFIARYMPTVQYDYMKKVISELGVKQAAEKAEIIAHPFKWLPKKGV